MRTVVAFALLLFATSAHAWSEFGHRLVGELAERQLSEAARMQIADLLQDEPDASLAATAPWPDVARDLPAYESTGPLHYVNIADTQCRYDATRDCRDGQCVIAAIPYYTQRLANTTLPRAQRAEALKFLVHFVGDIHQPLHAGNHDDRGGNDFQINLDGQGTNLHAVWDRLILQSVDLPFDAYVDRLDAQRRDSVAVIDGDAQAWGVESCALIDSAALYPAKPGTLDPAYLARMRPLAEARLVFASQRLAMLLEHTLGAAPNR